MTSQQRRLSRLREALGERQLDAILITNLTSIQYLSGFTGSAALLLVMADQAHFLSDGRYTDQASDQVRECQVHIDPGSTAPRQEKGLAGLLHELHLLPAGIRTGIESDHMPVGTFDRLKQLFPGVQWSPTSQLVSRLAMVKDDDELKALREAVHITDEAFTELLPYLKVGAIEREVAARLSYLLRMNGSDRDSFDPIVASGWRGALPHARASGKALEEGDFVVLDFGAVTDGYHADMTRTVCMGIPSDRHEEVYGIVLEAQLRGIAAIRAGASAREVDSASRDHIIANGYGQQFTHGTGHGIGLEVHTPPRLSQASDELLEAGMVVTVEPGIYISKWGGVRIEDDVLVLPDGSAPLNQSTKELLVLG